MNQGVNDEAGRKRAEQSHQPPAPTASEQTGKPQAPSAQSRPGGGATYAHKNGPGSASQKGQLTLNASQAKVVQNFMRRENVPKLSRADVFVSVGVTAPDDVEFYPLPPDIVAVLPPQYAHFDYMLVDDEMVIVDPGNRQIVSMFDEGGQPVIAQDEGRAVVDILGGRVGGLTSR